jgi:hypothetical protein
VDARSEVGIPGYCAQPHADDAGERHKLRIGAWILCKNIARRMRERRRLHLKRF